MPSPGKLLYSRQLVQLTQSSSGLYTTVKQLKHHSKQGKTMVGMIPLPRKSLSCSEVQATNGGRWSEGVVKSTADTFRSYVVQKPQGEYRRDRLQLKEAAILTKDPGSTSTASTTTSSTVQPTSVFVCRGMPTKPLCPIKELPNNNKGDCNVSSKCASDSSEDKIFLLLQALSNILGTLPAVLYCI